LLSRAKSNYTYFGKEQQRALKSAITRTYLSFYQNFENKSYKVRKFPHVWQDFG